jgi:DNA-binding CsgD family transcriptional regulator/tetratricopeptide (TPR) repeat protein
MPSHIPQRGLLGRHSESTTLDRLLDVVRAGESRALVIRGDPGVGKTALLEYVVQRATGCRVAQAMGVQAEMELAFAGLHQLCAPMLDRLERLPDPQRAALASAFGLTAGHAPDGFLVGLAVLSLLAEVSEERPLVCLIDDAQWLDHASAQALAFVARRLVAESVGVIFAVRTGGGEALTGLPELVVGGLSDRDARTLLAIRGPWDERVRDRIVAEARGNPLALLELPRAITPAELAGGFGRPYAPGLAGRIEESFRRRLDPLPAETRCLVLIAAAEPVGDPVLLWRAAEHLGIGADAATPATAGGLFELGARVRFRHPLVRSAIYSAASQEERRTVHRALAEATDPDVDPDRRAWHRAHAAPGPDEDVASEVERSADRAQARGGLAAAAAFLERATELTLEPARRAQRALAAAQASYQAGAPDAALALLATAQAGPLDELQRARVDLLRGQIAFVVSRGRDATPILLKAAKQLEPLDLALARETYLDALWAALIFGGPVADGGGLLEVAMAARGAPAPEPTRAADLLLDGLAALFTEGRAAAAPMLKRAVSAFRGDDVGMGEGVRWLWFACHIAITLWDEESWEVLSNRHLELAREAGALTVVLLAMNNRLGLHEHVGELQAAASMLEEADSIAEATGSQFPPYGALTIAAWRGHEAVLTELIEDSIDDTVGRAEAAGLTIIQWSSAVLYNGLGRYPEALAAAQQASVYAHDFLYSTWALVEMIEAAVRSGEPEPAAEALQRLSHHTRAGGTDWALGVEARSRALLSEDETADRLYGEAIERLARTRIRVDLARAHLLYGEWLRREKRRLDAREQLRIAHEMFTAMGLEAFAQRAARELDATGATARKRTVESTDQLTAREAQIARLAGDGLSNPEIGARLFISPRTVEYHLHKVYGKLDITSRNELAGALGGEAGAALSV